MTTRTITSFEQLAAESQHVNLNLVEHLLATGKTTLAVEHLQRAKHNAQLDISFVDHLRAENVADVSTLDALRTASLEVIAATNAAQIVATYESLLVILDKLCGQVAPQLNEIVYEAV